MEINQVKFNQVVEAAKAKSANHPEWLRSIEKASAGILDGSLVVTLFADNTALVTSANGSYLVNGHCPCAARTRHCYHKASARLMELYELTRLELLISTGNSLAEPEITRSVERDVVTRRRVRVTRCDGWTI